MEPVVKVTMNKGLSGTAFVPPLGCMATARPCTCLPVRGGRTLHGRVITPWVFVAPGMTILAVSTLGLMSQPGGASFQLWQELAKRPELWREGVLCDGLRSRLSWFVLYMLALPAGLTLALMIHPSLRRPHLGRSVFIFPVVAAQMAVGLMSSGFHAPGAGAVYSVTGWATGTSAALMATEPFVACRVFAAGLWPQIASAVILCRAGLNAGAAPQVNAARLDGASGWRMLWHVVLPQLRTAILIAVIIAVLAALRSLGLVSIMALTGTLQPAAYEQALADHANWMGYGAAIAVVLSGLILVCISGTIWRTWCREKGS